MAWSTVCTAVVFAASATAVNAENDDGSHIWMPKQPSNKYWQAPAEWPKPNQNAPAANQAQKSPVNQQRPPQRPASPPPYAGNYRGQSPAPYGGYNRPPQTSKPATGMNRSASMPPPPSGPYSATPNRSTQGSSAQGSRAQGSNAAPRMPYGSYRSSPYRSAPYRGAPYRGYRDNGASAFYTPGYSRYRSGRNDDRFWDRSWNKRKPWKDSGPSKWFNPTKENWEDSWEDMINAPSNMGEMPGGWYAPYVSMPNPIDVGDQFKDNVKDLPEQIRDMDVGNEVVDED